MSYEQLPPEEEEEAPLPPLARGGIDILIRDENVSHLAATLDVASVVTHLFRTGVLTNNIAAANVLLAWMELALKVKGFARKGLRSEEALGTALGLYAASLSNISSGVGGRHLQQLATIISVRRTEVGGGEEERKGILGRLGSLFR